VRRQSTSFRLLRYLRPYRGRLLLTALLMVGFALSSGVTIGMISPFMKVLFTPRPAVSGAEHAGSASLEGVLGSAPQAPGNASGTYVPGSGLVGRVNAWKQDLRTWFEHFFLTGDPLRSLTRICLVILVVFMLKNLFDYLEGGESIDEFLEGFPSVTRSQVIAFLEEAKDRLIEAAL